MTSIRNFLFVILCLGFLGFSAPLFAQNTATLTGRVVDPAGLPVADAQVEVRELQTGGIHPTETNSAGFYAISGLPPGTYRLSVQKPGFKQDVKSGIVLHIQENVSINFALQIGSASETVTVQAGGININTADGTVSTLVNATIVANMPLNGRSFQDLILLTPGVVGTPPIQYTNQSEEFGFSVNGQRPDANYFTVDGVSANVASTRGTAVDTGAVSNGSQGPLSMVGTTQPLVSVDDMQEFRVQTSSYAAEYGRNPGGQIGVQTKSGTNTFHGDVYDYLRNSGVGAANDYFYNYDNLPRTPGDYSTPPLRQNDFGGAFGGPVNVPGIYHGKDKTFFFVNYEGLRLTTPGGPMINAVPDLCLRGLATTTDPCPPGTPTVTAAYAPVQAVLKVYPYPNFQAESPIAADRGLGEDAIAPVGVSAINNYSIRVDQFINDKMTLFFRFSNTTSSEFSNTEGVLITGGASLTRTYTAGVNNTFTNKLSNEFRFNYSVSNTGGGAIPSTNAYTDAASIPCAVSSTLSGCGISGTSTPLPSFPATFNIPPSIASTMLPAFIPVNPSASGIALTGSRLFDQQAQWNPVDTLSYSVGPHHFKFGVDYRRIPGTVEPTGVELIEMVLSSLESGVMTLGTATADGPFHPVYTNFSAFAQDTWKTTQRLTLSLGLRWDVNPAPSVWQGNMPYTVTGTNASSFALACTNGPETAGQSCDAGTPLWQTTWFNFAPRLGVAYQLRTNPGWQTVLRGGGGVFYDTGQQEGSIVFLGPGYASARKTLIGCTFPGFDVTGCTAGATFPAAQYPVMPSSSATLYGISTHLQLPYTLQWNVSVEQGLGKVQSLSLTYVGSHGSRLLDEIEYQSTTNPNGEAFIQAQNGPTSDYDALQAHFQRQLSRGLTFLASYTWSHCIDYGSVNFLLPLQRGNCDYDIRQQFTSSFSYNLPNVAGNAVVKAVLDHWGVDDYLIARTGFPLFLQGSTFINTATDSEELNAVYEVLGQPQWLYGSNCISTLKTLGELTGGIGQSICPGGRALNPCAFASGSINATTGVTTYSPVNAECLPSGTTTYTSSQVGGEVPRNGLRGYDAVQMNLAIRREFPIYERLKLQFHVEAFNVFNHPNFGQFALTGGSAQFGLATASLATASGAFGGGGGAAAQYQTGGPRTLQFALKLIF